MVTGWIEASQASIHATIHAPTHSNVPSIGSGPRVEEKETDPAAVVADLPIVVVVVAVVVVLPGRKKKKKKKKKKKTPYSLTSDPVRGAGLDCSFRRRRRRRELVAGRPRVVSEMA